MKNVSLILCIILIENSGWQLHAQPGFDTNLYGGNKTAGHYIKTRRFSIYYEIYGKGEPLLMIHGNGGSINNFMYQIPYFSREYQVIVADSRAQGKSIDNSDSLSYEMMADDLNALLDSLRLSSCYVIGWSDGGINGLLLAIRHPNKVKKLAVTGANLWPDTSAINPFAYNWAMNYNKNLRKQQQTTSVKNKRKLYHLLSYEPHITLQQLHMIKCPTLVIGGDHDIILPQHTLLIAQNIARSYLWILPNSGHSTPVYYKDQFNKVVDDFFKKPYRNIEGQGIFE
ncbi:MAG TPA: alpha/beta hydrolase [Chitinophagaceae bacterium]|jgi:pimeloyl-ACP methyl ester carboxylesterase